MTEQEIENELEAHNFTEDEQKRFDKCLDSNCTSRCGNDIDCPHEEYMLGVFLEERLSVPH